MHSTVGFFLGGRGEVIGRFVHLLLIIVHFIFHCLSYVLVSRLLAFMFIIFLITLFFYANNKIECKFDLQN